MICNYFIQASANLVMETVVQFSAHSCLTLCVVQMAKHTATHVTLRLLYARPIPALKLPREDPAQMKLLMLSRLVLPSALQSSTQFVELMERPMEMLVSFQQQVARAMALLRWPMLEYVSMRRMIYLRMHAQRFVQQYLTQSVDQMGTPTKTPAFSDPKLARNQ